VESDLGHFFSAVRQNIGVLLGEPSRWLVDVDLDHPLALALADSYLPPTDSVFGRAGKRRSHRLYYVTGPVSTRQWRVGKKQMIVELRSTGGQTVFPGSVHPTGEIIEWEIDGEPAIVDPDELRQCLQRIYFGVCRLLKVSVLPTSTNRVQSHPHAPTVVIDRARKYLSKLPLAVSGQGGHSATFHAACKLVIGFGLDRDDALSLLRQWNATCQPPWSERELEHKVDDALKQPGWRGYLLAALQRPLLKPTSSPIERANRHAIEHRRRARRRAHA
jgi:hypothetical protein